MAFWSKCFSTTPPTIDEQIIAAGKAAGVPKDIVQNSIRQVVATGMKKETLLQSYLDRAKK